LLIDMLAYPVREELNGRAVAQRGVAATPVVEHLAVLEQVGLRINFSAMARRLTPPAADVFGAVEVNRWTAACGGRLTELMTYT